MQRQDGISYRPQTGNNRDTAHRLVIASPIQGPGVRQALGALWERVLEIRPPGSRPLPEPSVQIVLRDLGDVSIRDRSEAAMIRGIIRDMDTVTSRFVEIPLALGLPVATSGAV